MIITMTSFKVDWITNSKQSFIDIELSEIVCKKFDFELFKVDVDIFFNDVCKNVIENVIDVEISTIDWVIASKHNSIDVELN